MGVSQESRTTQRVAIANQVNLDVRGQATMMAFAVNISLGGLCMMGLGRMPLDSFCRVAIAVPVGLGCGTVLAEGRVVRSGEGLTAIQFSRALAAETLELISRPVPTTVLSSLKASLPAYFRVSRGDPGWDCEQVFGIPTRIFRRLSIATLLTSLPVAGMLLWLLRGQVHLLPDWLKVLACFGYGVAWLMVVQPLADLALIRLLRPRWRRS